MPTASAAASALWKSATSLERWEQLRARHADLQRRAGVASLDPAKLARLAELDAECVLGALPRKLHGGNGNGKAPTAPLTRDDLVRAVEWKLLRGKWRPALLGYAKAQTDSAVGAAAAKALAALGKAGGGSGAAPPTDAQARAALDAFCALRGVGPATASIFMCAATSGQVPYMSDEALEACVGSRKYNANELLALTTKLRAKAKELTALAVGKGGGREGRAWTAEDVQRALHAAELEARVLQAKGAGGGGGKKGGEAGGAAKASQTMKKSGESGDGAPAEAPATKRRRRR